MRPRSPSRLSHHAPPPPERELNTNFTIRGSVGGVFVFKRHPPRLCIYMYINTYICIRIPSVSIR